MNRRLSYFILAAALAIVLAGSGVLASHYANSAMVSSPPKLAEGVAALDRYDYATARQIFIALAQSGDAQAEMWLGRLDQEGLGAPASGTDSIAWFTKAAQSGNPEAERRLGELYLHGDLVLQDIGQARHWLDQAAEHNDPVAARDLGTIYASGLGVPKDPKKAYAWFSIAASTGDRNAAAERDKLLSSLSSADAAQAQSLAQATLHAISAPGSAAQLATATPAAPPAS